MRLQLPFNKVLEISEETFVERRDENIVVVVVFFTATQQIVQQLIPGTLVFQLSSLDNFICFVFLTQGKGPMSTYWLQGFLDGGPSFSVHPPGEMAITAYVQL